jgi:hypothetical protein
VAASRLEAVDLCSHLNDLEGHHEALACAALNAVQVVRPEGQQLPDCLRLLPCEVKGVVALGIRGGPPACWPRRRFGPAGI